MPRKIFFNAAKLVHDIMANKVAPWDLTDAVFVFETDIDTVFEPGFAAPQHDVDALPQHAAALGMVQDAVLMADQAMPPRAMWYKESGKRSYEQLSTMLDKLGMPDLMGRINDYYKQLYLDYFTQANATDILQTLGYDHHLALPDAS